VGLVAQTVLLPLALAPGTSEVTLRGDLKLESWNPHTGETSPLKSTAVKKNGSSFTRAALQLDPVKSLFFVESLEK
jgi:hypothetical protein